MNLRSAIKLFLAGCIYVIFHKIISDLFPVANTNSVIGNILWALLLLSNISIILFAVFFIKDIPILPKQIKTALRLVMFFTTFLILEKMQIVQPTMANVKQQFIFEIVKLLNNTAMTMFALYLFREVSPEWKLDSSLKKLIQSSLFFIVVTLISLYELMIVIIHGRDNQQLFVLQLISTVAFLLMYITRINFLVKLKKVDNYSNLIG